MVENFDEFYEDFYKPQFEWYDTKAISNKKYHRGMKISQIVLAAISIRSTCAGDPSASEGVGCSGPTTGSSLIPISSATGRLTADLEPGLTCRNDASGPAP